MSAVATEPGARRAAAPVPALGAWDWWLFGTVVVQALFGLLMILSASSLQADARYGNALHFASRQVTGLGVGVVLSLLVLRTPWSVLRSSRTGWAVWGAAFVGLVLVLTSVGHEVNGATRWIRLGPVNAQPSEFAKLALIFTLSCYLSANEGRIRDFTGVVVPAIGFVTAPLLVLVMAQPDFGTTVLLAGLMGVLLFLAGLPKRFVFGLGGLGATGLAVLAVAAPYRMRRLTSFWDPFADPDGAGYQVVQGWIALASGGLSGRGLAAGVAQSGFLPEAHTDFISAVVGEELGAIGWVMLVASYVVVVWRGTRIASRATDLFGSLLAQGITVLLAGQAVINLGVVCGVLPAKGLVLPFLSYGSSAALVHTLCVGLLLRVSMENRARAPGGER